MFYFQMDLEDPDITESQLFDAVDAAMEHDKFNEAMFNMDETTFEEAEETNQKDDTCSEAIFQMDFENSDISQSILCNAVDAAMEDQFNEAMLNMEDTIFEIEENEEFNQSMNSFLVENHGSNTTNEANSNVHQALAQENVQTTLNDNTFCVKHIERMQDNSDCEEPSTNSFRVTEDILSEINDEEDKRLFSYYEDHEDEQHTAQ